MTENRLESGSSWIWIDEAGLLRVQTKPDIHETLDHAIETIKCVMRAIGSQKRGMVVDARVLKSQDAAALAYYRGSQNQTVLLCGAYIIPSKFGSIIGNIFMPKKNQVPVRLFSEEDPAVAWVHEQLASLRSKTPPTNPSSSAPL